MEITVQPIPVYPAYYVCNGQIYGIPLDIYGPRDMVPIIPAAVIDGVELPVKTVDFCTVGGAPHWTVVVMEPVEGGDPIEHVMPVKMSLGQVSATTYDVPPMSIAALGEFSGKFYLEVADGRSVVHQEGRPDEPLGCVENYFRCNAGLLLSATHGRGSSRKSGLLMWRLGKSNMDHFMGPGRLWT